VRDGTRWHVRWYETSVATVSRCPSKTECESKDRRLDPEVTAFALDMTPNWIWQDVVGTDPARKRLLEHLKPS
jgi:hypothetical protein